MSLVISSSLQTIIDSGVRAIQNTCEITFPNNPPIRVASAPLTIGGNAYSDDLRAVSEIKRSLEAPIDRVTVSIQNVDRVIGQNVAAYPDEWRLAEARIGRHYSGAGLTAWIEMFRGIVQQPTVDDLTLKFGVVPDVLSKGAFIAGRSLAPLCPWRFKDPLTCGYSGSATTCNHHLRSMDGCLGRGRTHAFGGTEHRYPPDASIPGTGGNSGGDIVVDGGCPTLDQYIVTNEGTIRVRELSMAHELYNPIDGRFYRIKSLQSMESDLVYILAANGAECWASMTHKLLWYREHVTGETVTKFAEGDPLLCWNQCGRVLEDSRVESLRFNAGRGTVMKIEMDGGHIYCCGNDGWKLMAAHNSKNPLDV